MSLRLLEIGIALLLALECTAAGDLVIGRRSRSLVDANESFLAGLALATLALFPLSLLLPTHALTTVAALLGVAALVWLIRARRSQGDGAAPRRWARDPLGMLLLAGILVALLCFATLDLRYSYAWDGFQVFASKAMVLFYRGGLVRELWPEPGYAGRLVDYPNLVPTYEALVALLRGGFTFGALKPVFIVFFASLLLSTWTAARALVSPRIALVATLLIGTTPGVVVVFAPGGYADMPLAAMLTAALGAALRARDWDAPTRRSVACLLGGWLMVKKEGILLLAALAIVLAVASALRPALRRALVAEWSSMTILGAFLAGRILYPLWTGWHDTTFGPIDSAHLMAGIARLPAVISRCLRLACDLPTWGLLWIALLPAAVVLLWRGTPVLRTVTAALLCALGMELMPYLLTNWEVIVHVDGAFPRQLAALAPIAMVLVVTAYARVFAPDTGPPRAAPPPSARKRARSSKRPRSSRR